MIIKIIAYTIAVLLSPVISGFVMIIGIPLGFFVNILKNTVKIESWYLIQQGSFVVLGFLSNFISVWLISKIFIFFNIEPTLLMVILIGVFLTWHQWTEANKYQGQRAEIEIADLWGGVIGIIIAGMYILK